MFHLEAGLARAGFQRDDTGILPRGFSRANGGAGLAIIERLTPIGRALTDSRLLTFCRDWYVAINTVVRPTPGWTSGGYDLESPRQHLGDDYQILALLGTSAAGYMGPWRQGDGPYGFGNEYDQWRRRIPTITANGETYNAEDVRRAETSFRRALQSNPSFAEARLRLARVLQLTNRRRNAIVELTGIHLESSPNWPLARPSSSRGEQMTVGRPAGRSSMRRQAHRSVIHGFCTVLSGFTKPQHAWRECGPSCRRRR
jgi:hypothetical protein